jgi:putative endonuclease
MVNLRTNWENVFCVYILKSKKDNNLYIGSTNNLERRINEHSAGLVFSTKARVPFDLVYYEAYKSESDARNREKNLKIRSRAFAQLKKRIKESLQK